MWQADIIKKLGILAFVLLNISCDQITKEMVRNRVEPNAYIPVIKDHLILTNVENEGAMMGFGQDLSPVLKIIFLQALPLVVLLLLLGRILQKTNLNRWLILAFALVVGGGIGNLIDRIAYGSVTDFFQIKMGILRTGIFNMADVSVSIGVLFILFLSLRKQKLSL